MGDLVILSDNEYLAKSEFDLLSDFQWVDQMRFMLGEKFPIVAIFDPKTVVLPSPDGSQDWYFPKSLVTKVSGRKLYSNSESDFATVWPQPI